MVEGREAERGRQSNRGTEIASEREKLVGMRSVWCTEMGIVLMENDRRETETERDIWLVLWRLFISVY